MASDDVVEGSNTVVFHQTPPLYAESKEAAVSTFVNLAEEAKLISEGVKAPGHAVLTIYQYKSFFGRRKSCPDKESLFSRKSFTDNFKPVAMEQSCPKSQMLVTLGYLWQHGMWEVKHLAMTRIWRNGCMHELQQTFTFWVSRNCPSTGNILGAENNGAAAKWPNLIHGTLNNSGTCKNINQCDCLSSRSDKTADIPEAVYGLDSDLECSRVRKSSFFSSRRSFLDLNILSKPDCEAKYDPKKLEQKCGLADHLFQGKSIHRVDCSSSFMSVSSDDKYGLSEGESHSTMLSSPFSDKSDSSRMSNKFNSTKEKYYLEASKRMVGIFLCIGHVAI